jgi:hypothetical protein
VRWHAREAALFAVLALGATGCEHLLGLGEPTVIVDAGIDAPACEDQPLTARQVVIDGFQAPTTSAAARDAAFDIDGDSTTDNAIFVSLASLVTLVPAFEIQSTIDDNLATGQLLQLLQADLQGACATTTLFEGGDRDMPANPADNFSGQESFDVLGIPRGRMTGARAGAVVSAGTGGTAELRLPLFTGTTPIELPLIEARVRYEVTADGLIEGAIGGAIRADVIDGVVIPSFAASLQAAVARDCGGTAPDCCVPESAGEAAVQLFDDDADCAIAGAEVAEAQVIRTLFSVDLDLYNGGVMDPQGDGLNDSLSIGIPFTAVNGFFLVPP